ncbi:MAG: SDR family NAD(P)-dependent oxidoreductase, partial [Polyangiales bacterium]
AELFLCDVSSMASIDEWVADLKQKHPKIDVLINNAGVYYSSRVVTEDGFEKSFATNYIAPLLITEHLLDAVDGGRIIYTNSSFHRFARFDTDNLQAEKSLFPLRHYGTTKLLTLLFMRELTRRAADRDLFLAAYHPGIVGTRIAQQEWSWMGTISRIGTKFVRSPKTGADTGIYLATSDDVLDRNGQYWFDRKLGKLRPDAKNDGYAKELWSITEALLGRRIFPMLPQ